MNNEQDAILQLLTAFSGVESNELHEDNIFRILRIETKEQYHSRILKYFIDKYTQEFLSDCLDLKGENKEYIDVEYSFLNTCCNYTNEKSATDGRIDIYLETKKYIIPIEVKIYAEDQKLQLLRYYNFAQNIKNEKEVVLVYLTYGEVGTNRAASAKSTKCEEFENCKNCHGELTQKLKNDHDYENKYLAITIKDDVKAWLKGLKHLKKNNDLLIEQYLEIIEKDKKDMENVKKILNSKETFETAIIIKKNLQNAKKLIAEQFMHALEAQLQNKLDFRGGFTTRLVGENLVYSSSAKIENNADNLNIYLEIQDNLYCGFKKEEEGWTKYNWMYIYESWLRSEQAYPSINKGKIDGKFLEESNPLVNWYFNTNEQEKERQLKNVCENILSFKKTFFETNKT